MESALAKHLKLVHKHRKYVLYTCFKMGLYWQGLIHDLSKYSITELSIAKYYTGEQSPHETCREELGYSPCWVHHYHKNKHHWEYWLDIGTNNKIIPIKMPYKYVIESVCDMIGASKAYNKNWNSMMPLKYWNTHNNDSRIMHSTSLFLAKYLIEKLSILGEKNFYLWYNKNKKELKLRYNTETLKDFREIKNHD